MNIKLNPNSLIRGCTTEQESYCGGLFLLLITTSLHYVDA